MKALLNFSFAKDNIPLLKKVERRYVKSNLIYVTEMMDFYTNLVFGTADGARFLRGY